MKEILKFGMTPEKYTTLHHILATVVDECVMEFDEDGLSVAAVNLANTSIVKVFMPKRAFTEYEIENPVRVGIDLRDMEERGLLNDNDGGVGLTLSEQDGRHDCKVSHDIFCETLCLLNPDTMKKPKWKEIKTDCNFSLPTSVLRKVSSRGAFLCVECGNSHVTFSDEFYDNVWATVPIPITCGVSVKARYSAEWFQDITDAVASEHIGIRLSDDYPCVIKSKFGNGCVAEWLVAPRIQSD